MTPADQATLTRTVTRPHRYSRAQVLELTGVGEQRVIRWLQAGIIEAAAGGGSPGIRREFTLKNLIEIVVCNELRALGLSEPALRVVVTTLQAIWQQPDTPTNHRQPDGPTYREAPILWLALQRYEFDNRVQETLAMYPIGIPDLVSRVTDGAVDGSGVAESGIMVPLARITRELEQRTGDVLVWG